MNGNGWGGTLWVFALGAVGNMAQAQILLSEVSDQIGVAFMHKTAALAVPGFQEFMPSGVAVGDFNRDGFPDIFVLLGGIEADRLFINTGRGTFVNQARLWGVNKVHAGCGVSAADYDKDGWIDLYITSFGNGTDNKGQHGKNILYHNNGNGTFTDVAATAGLAFTSMPPSTPSGYGSSWGDYDLDGDLDLYVCAWVTSSQANKLFRNNGDGTFTNVTTEAGVFQTAMAGFQSCFADMDEDGWPELLVSADFKTSRYFKNEGNGTFSDYTLASGTGKDQNGMGQTVADFDGDGRLDWYVTSIYLDNPNPAAGEGNKLYMNDAAHLYLEIAQDAGVDDGGWGWGTVGVDLDQDGLIDLVEVNGRTGSAEFGLEPEYVYRNDSAWPNNLSGTFSEISELCGLVVAAEGRTISWLDYDLDGDLDLALGFNNDPFKFYRNDSPAPGSWLFLTFDTSNNPLLPADGFGVKVTAIVGGKTYVDVMDGGPSFLGTSEFAVHLGLGDAAVIDELTIRWPRGYTKTMTNVPVNQRMNVISPVPGDFNVDGQVNGADLGILLSFWEQPLNGLELYVDLNNDHHVDGADLGLLLSQWTG